MAYNYFNWYDLFVNEVSGSTIIFFALSIALIAYVCAKFRVPNMIILLLISVWTLMLGVFPGFGWLLPLSFVGIGTFVGWQLYKIFTR